MEEEEEVEEEEEEEYAPHTHTHTHTLIYIYVYIKFVEVYFNISHRQYTWFLQCTCNLDLCPLWYADIPVLI